ncbi:MAG: PLP-dependent cysteine synthase family protein [Gammaproteobacteria bacterium]|nr:PLP-dependent cysteine synthase family protein [Gammaproteobacteria bacterium]
MLATAGNSDSQRAWSCHAIGEIEADATRSADTHLIRLDLPQFDGVRIYLKDESVHPSGSLKHRLARSLILYGICNGWIREGTTLIETSSGSTAISEAYFARLLKLPFAAVVPNTTAPQKLLAIEHFGGRIHPATGAGIAQALAAVVRETGGHYLDQFTYAERATDWRSNNNIAEALFAQMAREPQPQPDWIVVGAGTGGTSATIGRFIRYQPRLAAHTRLCVVDPEHSAFFPAFAGRAMAGEARASQVVEGVGRPRVEPSFIPSVVDRMLCAPDAASVASARWLSTRLGRRVGASTGLNFLGCLQLAGELHAAGRPGAIASLICDGGERYGATIFQDDWLRAQGLDLAPWTAAFEAFEATGQLGVCFETADRR